MQRRFEDLGHRSQQSREQQVTEALEKRRELRRKQDECMRKPWKRPATPKKEILKRGDGARRRRAALQRSIEKAADELGHQAPGAWHKPAAEASYGVRQFMQQQRALRRGESPVQPEAAAPHVKNQIPWQDVKIAAEQRFQALLGVEPQQQVVPSGIWSPQPYACDTHSLCDDGLVDVHSFYPSHTLGSHTDRPKSPPYQDCGPEHIVRRPSSQSQSASARKRSKDGASDNVCSDPRLPQRTPTLSHGAAVCITHGVAANGDGAPELPLAASALGLTFSDLVRQSINRAQIAAKDVKSREGQSIQTPGSVVAAAEYPAIQQRPATPPRAEVNSPAHSYITTVDNDSHSSKEQDPRPPATVAASLSDEQPSSTVERPVPGARPASGSRPARPAAPEIQTHQAQRPCSASSFSGILSDSSNIHATCAVRDSSAEQPSEAATPSISGEVPSDVSRLQAWHTQHAGGTALRSTDANVPHAQGNLAAQQASPADRMQQLLQNMQQLQILRERARQELEATSSRRVTADAPAVSQTEEPTHTPRHGKPHEEGLGHEPQDSIPAVQKSQPSLFLPELNRRTRGKNLQAGRAAHTGGSSEVGRPESPKRGMIASGKGDCDRALVHGLERSCPGATVPCRQQSSSFSDPNSVPFQRHGETGDAADQHACIAKPSQRVQSAQGLYGSDGALSEAHNQQSVSFHGPDTESGSITTSHKRMKACQRTHPSEATHMPLQAPVGGEDGMQQSVDREQTRKNFNDMTLHGWVSAAPAEAKQCNAVRSRRRCVRGDSAQSCLSRQEHPASTNQQDSRIPQPPRAEYRSPVRPCADLTPLRMTPHSNLPVVRRREQEYAEELTLFEREFQELDSDPEVLAMIRKKRDVPNTVAPCPHGLSMGSVRSGCEPLRSNRFAAEPSKMVYGNGSAHVPHSHPRSSTGMQPENPVTRFGRKQDTCDTPGKWQATDVQGLSESMEMRQLEASLEHLNGRLMSSRQVRKRNPAVGHTRPCRPPIPRTGGYARNPRGKQTARPSPRRERRNLKRPEKARPITPPQELDHMGGMGSWGDATQLECGYGKCEASPEARLVRTTSARSRPTRMDMDVHTSGLPTSQEAHRLWRHIITAGMVATFGSGAANSLGGWDAMAFPSPKSLVGSKLGAYGP